MDKLTGQTRHRLHRSVFSHRLVLQVEVQSEGTIDPTFLDRGPSFKYWRDARIEDMTFNMVVAEVFRG